MFAALTDALRDPRTIWYLTGHLILVVGGIALAGIDDWTYARPIGLSLISAGLAGYVIFGYLLTSQKTADRLEVLHDFGIQNAFSTRATKIEDEYKKRLAGANDHIDVLAFGLSALREDFRGDFEKWKATAKVRILLIDPNYPSPNCSFADERDREEMREPGQIRADVRNFLKELEHLRDESFQIRLYQCLPAVNIFRVDNEVFWGPYFVGQLGRNTPTLVIGPGTLFNELVRHFDSIWHSSDLSRAVPDNWREEL